jgi:cytochrome d ubiquinol oxidase subunit II
MAPELIVLLVMMIALTLYALLGGADFGAGVWEFNTALQATEKEQRLIYGAMGPVWEANHVWLIFVLVTLSGAFPTALAGLSRALWVPLLLALAGIVFRGVGFAFHSYATGAVRQQAAWGAVFAVASTATPFFLGAAVGAVACGHLEVTPDGDYTGDYLTGWICPLAIFTAFFAVAICAYLAAVYLARDAARTGDAELVRLWRQRALASGAWLGILAFTGLVVVAMDSPFLWQAFRARAWPLVGMSIAAGLCSLGALWTSRFTAAAVGAGATVTVVVWSWAVAQYPVLVPPSITVATAKAPAGTLWAMVWSIGAGTVLILPALGCLFYLFKGRRPAARHEGTSNSPVNVKG